MRPREICGFGSARAPGARGAACGRATLGTYHNGSHQRGLVIYHFVPGIGILCRLAPVVSVAGGAAR